MESMKSKGSLCRIRKCAFDLLSMEEDLVDDNAENLEFIGRDLRLKSTFLYFDLNQIISIADDEHKKASLTDLANRLFYCIEELGQALKSRRVSLIQIHYHDAASVLREVIAALMSPLQIDIRFRRRTAAIATVILGSAAITDSNKAFSFELRFTVPDQTPEEAYAGIRSHAQDLLQIKSLIDSQSWRGTQKTLRQSSSYLKQDLYTIIQARPGNERPLLRKLYSNLFNNVSRLDYAARSKDAAVVQECYDNIVTAIDEIFTRI